jgi:hypothetical protein
MSPIKRKEENETYLLNDLTLGCIDAILLLSVFCFGKEIPLLSIINIG